MIIIDPKNPEESWNNFRKQKHEMGLIIHPLLEKYNLEHKEVLEVCQIGKFIFNFNPNIRIIDKPKPPSPDFLLELDGKIIGLEHTRVTDPLKRKEYFPIVNLLNSAAEEFKVKYPEKRFSAVFTFTGDSFEFKTTEKRHLIELINSFVLDALQGNYATQPDFISTITLMPNSIFSYSYKEQDFYGNKLPLEEVKSSIKDKEVKLEKYYGKVSNINEFWLVLMVGSLSQTTYEIDEQVDYKTTSTFDKVYLMSDFEEKIVEVK